MSIKMKGFLKGLRYISQIFDSKEQEMQIGFPTDVKHVAHIGWSDDPSQGPPTWMNAFKSEPLGTVGAEATADQAPSRYSSNDGVDLDGQLFSKQRRQEMPAARHSRRNKSATAISMDSQGGEKLWNRRQGAALVFRTPADAPIPDMPAIPKISRKKKNKKETAGGGGSTRSARAKAQVVNSEAVESGESLPAMKAPAPAEAVM